MQQWYEIFIWHVDSLCRAEQTSSIMYISMVRKILYCHVTLTFDFEILDSNEYRVKINLIEVSLHPMFIYMIYTFTMSIWCEY